MATTTPTWTDQGAVISSRAVSATATYRTTVDLRTKIAARFFVTFGRTGTTAFTGTSPSFHVRPMANNATSYRAPASPHSRQSGSVTAVAPTVNGATIAGATSFVVSSATSLAVGDILCLSPGDANQEEWCRISRINSTTIYPDAPLINAHDNGDTVTNQGDSWIIVVPGGCYYELIVDYGGASAGSDIRVQVHYQTYDSDTTA